MVGRDATGLNRTSTVSNRGGIVSIRRSTVVNRSAAVMSRSGSVDESCRHRRSIVGHRIEAGISFFFHPDAPGFYHLSQIGMSPGESGLES